MKCAVPAVPLPLDGRSVPHEPRYQTALSMCIVNLVQNHGKLSARYCMMIQPNSKKILINLIGKKFGRLTVIKRHGIKFRPVRWSCKCPCGKLVVVSGEHLRDNPP